MSHSIPVGVLLVRRWWVHEDYDLCRLSGLHSSQLWHDMTYWQWILDSHLLVLFPLLFPSFVSTAYICNHIIPCQHLSRFDAFLLAASESKRYHSLQLILSLASEGSVP